MVRGSAPAWGVLQGRKAKEEKEEAEEEEVLTGRVVEDDFTASTMATNNSFTSISSTPAARQNSLGGGGGGFVTRGGNSRTATVTTAGAMTSKSGGGEGGGDSDEESLDGIPDLRADDNAGALMMSKSMSMQMSMQMSMRLPEQNTTNIISINKQIQSGSFTSLQNQQHQPCWIRSSAVRRAEPPAASSAAPSKTDDTAASHNATGKTTRASFVKSFHSSFGSSLPQSAAASSNSPFWSRRSSLDGSGGSDIDDDDQTDHAAPSNSDDDWGWVRGLILHQQPNPQNLHVLVDDPSSSKDGQQLSISLKSSDTSDGDAHHDHNPPVLPANSWEYPNFFHNQDDSSILDHDHHQNGPPDDLIHLTHLHEPAIVSALETRFEQNIIYTRTGPMLIAVNPLKPRPDLYDQPTMALYRNAAAQQQPSLDNQNHQNQNLPPHVYDLADTAYQKMMAGLNQRHSTSYLISPPPLSSSSSSSSAHNPNTPKQNLSSRMLSSPASSFRLNNGRQSSSTSPPNANNTPPTTHHHHHHHHHHLHNLQHEQSNCDQSILISGDSGAGKTVSTKHVMEYLMALSRPLSSQPPTFSNQTMDRRDLFRQKSTIPIHPLTIPSMDIGQRVLQSNPLLESFGNARTIRNDNSSRFGKFIEMRFDTKTDTAQNNLSVANTPPVMGSFVGASIETYLLERVRLVQQAPGERNYHVFYELLAGATERELATYRLHQHGSVEEFRCTSQSGTFDRRDGVDDADNYDILQHAMTSIGFDSEERGDIFKIISFILHSSNVTFVNSADQGESSSTNDIEDLSIADINNVHLRPTLDLLGVDNVKDFNFALCHSTIRVGRESHVKNLDTTKAAKGLEALVKAMYDALFTHLVKKTNRFIAVEDDSSVLVAGSSPSSQRDGFGTTVSSGSSSKTSSSMTDLMTTMTPSSSSAEFRRSRLKKSRRTSSKTSTTALRTDIATIGVLDIFGFESFQTNSFEQLCINYCNETLQHQFNKFVLKNEQEEYEREGVPWSFIPFPENQDVIDIIEQRRNGIFSILDDQCRGANISDMAFATNVYKRCGKSPRFRANARQVIQMKFSLRHYAGHVEYDAAGFVEKNRDELRTELTALLLASSSAFVRELAASIVVPSSFPMVVSSPSASSSSSSSGPSTRRQTVAGRFGMQLRQLRRRIELTTPHYIRCLKPNASLTPDFFDPRLVVHQLRCSGVVEAVRVSRVGYPHRYTHGAFLHRYWFLVSSGGGEQQQSMELFVQSLSGVLQQQHQPGSQGKDLTITSATTDDGGTMDEITIEIGKTKVFLRRSTFNALEAMRMQKLNEHVMKVQSLVRAFLTRKFYLDICHRIILLQSFIRRRIAVVRASKLRRLVAIRRIQSTTRMVHVRRLHRSILYIAIWSQRLQRGRAVRRMAAALYRERKAAIVLQCAVRCMRAMRIYKERKEQAQSLKAIAEERDRLRKKAQELRAGLERVRSHASLMASSARQQSSPVRGGDDDDYDDDSSSVQAAAAAKMEQRMKQLELERDRLRTDLAKARVVPPNAAAAQSAFPSGYTFDDDDMSVYSTQSSVKSHLSQHFHQQHIDQHELQKALDEALAEKKKLKKGLSLLKKTAGKEILRLRQEAEMLKIQVDAEQQVTRRETETLVREMELLRAQADLHKKESDLLRRELDMERDNAKSEKANLNKEIELLRAETNKLKIQLASSYQFMVGSKSRIKGLERTPSQKRQDEAASNSKKESASNGSSSSAMKSSKAEQDPKSAKERSSDRKTPTKEKSVKIASFKAEQESVLKSPIPTPAPMDDRAKALLEKLSQENDSDRTLVTAPSRTSSSSATPQSPATSTSPSRSIMTASRAKSERVLSSLEPSAPNKKASKSFTPKSERRPILSRALSERRPMLVRALSERRSSRASSSDDNSEGSKKLSLWPFKGKKGRS